MNADRYVYHGSSTNQNFFPGGEKVTRAINVVAVSLAVAVVLTVALTVAMASASDVVMTVHAADDVTVLSL